MAVMITVPLREGPSFRDSLKAKTFSEEPIIGSRKDDLTKVYFILTDKQNSESEATLIELTEKHEGSFEVL